MSNKETPAERKKRFKRMTSIERKALIREKMKAEALTEGSGVEGRNLASYKQDEIWDLIQITRCFPEMQSKPNSIKSKQPDKKKSLVTAIFIAIAISSGIFLFFKQHPSAESRRELSIEVLFWD
tara:strand:+ start:541 stop:912 length:372 start_codon:yes stop_codon:yes gene_type:complete